MGIKIKAMSPRDNPLSAWYRYEAPYVTMPHKSLDEIDPETGIPKFLRRLPKPAEEADTTLEPTK